MRFINLAKRRGFTLVEIVVVVGIIGLLSSIILFSVSEVREQARDKQRKTDLKQMQLALEFYKEVHGRYPSNCDEGTADEWGWHGRGENHTGAPWYDRCDPAAGEEHIKGLAPTFIPKLPVDPRNNDSTLCGYNYLVRTDGSAYKLFLMCSVESLKVTTSEDEFARCPRRCVDSGFRTESYCIGGDGSGYALHGGSNGASNGSDAACW